MYEAYEAEEQKSVAIACCRPEMALNDNDLKSCLHEPDVSTKDFIMQQTMLRVKDPKISLDFYTRILGMRLVVNHIRLFCAFSFFAWHNFYVFLDNRLLGKYDFPEMKFSLYFVGYEKMEDIPNIEDKRTKWIFSRQAILELTQ